MMRSLARTHARTIYAQKHILMSLQASAAAKNASWAGSGGVSNAPMSLAEIQQEDARQEAARRASMQVCRACTHVQSY